MYLAPVKVTTAPAGVLDPDAFAWIITLEESPEVEVNLIVLVALVPATAPIAT